jgi:hypothetical protein
MALPFMQKCGWENTHIIEKWENIFNVPKGGHEERMLLHGSNDLGAVISRFSLEIAMTC